MATTPLPISQSDFDDLVRSAESLYEEARAQTNESTKSQQRGVNRKTRELVLNKILNPWDQRLNMSEISNIRYAIRILLTRHMELVERNIAMTKGQQKLTLVGTE